MKTALLRSLVNEAGIRLSIERHSDTSGRLRESSRFRRRQTELDHSPPLQRRKPPHTLREISWNVKLNYFCHGLVLQVASIGLDSLIIAWDAAGCHLIVKRRFANVPQTRSVTCSFFLESTPTRSRFRPTIIVSIGARPFHPYTRACRTIQSRSPVRL